MDFETWKKSTVKKLAKKKLELDTASRAVQRLEKSLENPEAGFSRFMKNQQKNKKKPELVPDKPKKPETKEKESWDVW